MELDQRVKLWSELTAELSAITEQKKQIMDEKLDTVRRMDEKLKLAEHRQEDIQSLLRQLVVEKVEDKYKDDIARIKLLEVQIAKLRHSLTQATATSKTHMREKSKVVKEAELLKEEMHRVVGEVGEMRRRCEAKDEQLVALKLLLVEAKCKASRAEKAAESVREELETVRDEQRRNRVVTELTQRRQLEESTRAAAAEMHETVLKTATRAEDCNSYTDEGHDGLLRKLYPQLIERIDASAVATRMFQRNALTLRELESIQSKRETPTEAAETLINILLKQPNEVYDCFMDCLKQCNQQHVYSWIISSTLTAESGNGSTNAPNAAIIRQHYVYLLETLNVKTSGLLDLLYSAEVLSLTELELISTAETATRRNEKLLSVLTRKSTEQFELFLTTLDETRQQHVRNTITGRKCNGEPQRLQESSANATSTVDRQRDDTDTSPTETLLCNADRIDCAARLDELLEREQQQPLEFKRREAKLREELRQCQETLVDVQQQLSIARENDELNQRKLKETEENVDRLAAEQETRCVQLLTRETGLRSEMERCEANVAMLQAPLEKALAMEKQLRQQLAKSDALYSACHDYVRSEPSLVHQLQTGESVHGVTSLDDRLYVLRRTAKGGIEVYHISTYRLLNRMAVPELLEPLDMTSCQQHRCLYIADVQSRCVHRVELDKVSVSRWTAAESPNGLSVTSSFCVVVTCPGRTVNTIKMFTTHGELLREINLNPTLLSPWHAIQLPDDQFVVCHGNLGDTLHRVCIVDSSGNVVRSYGGPSGSQTAGHLNIPGHLAVDRDGFVFVADVLNSRVVLLSPTLGFVREIVSSKLLQWRPYSLLLDADSRRLYVADSKWKINRYVNGRLVTVSVGF